jgi:pyruvate dehydrogenase E2 component (dihydrolipoamide acetyltransferase)
MADVLRVPATGNESDGVVLTEWLVEPGTAVTAGQPVAVLETAKSAIELEAPASGTVLRLLADPGTELEEHAPLLLIGSPDEPPDMPETTGPAAPTKDGAPARTAADTTSRIPADTNDHTASGIPGDTTTRGSGGIARDAEDGGGAHAARERAGARPPASPRARTLAHRYGLDLATLTGSGPGGRILAGDVVAGRRAADTGAATARPAPQPAGPGSGPGAETGRGGPGWPGGEGEVEVVPVRGPRRVTAERTLASLRDAAQLTLTRYADATALLAYAARLREAGGSLGLPRVTVNDLVLFAVARVLPGHAEANALFDWSGIRRHRRVGLGFAVDTGAALQVPVVRDAHLLSLAELAVRAHHLAERAHQGRLTAEESAGGTFTVTNLGMHGIVWFTPVLNTPQVAILGVGAADPDPAMPGRSRLPLSLTFDHRALDGSAAARALGAFAEAIAAVDLLAAR